jgi:hypothetical protein
MKYISAKIRNQVALRARFRCEYCQVQEEDMYLAFEIDHVIAQKHGEGHELSNLAYCCPHCNQHKGTDLATFIEECEDLVRLFNPRTDSWETHFSTSFGEIIAKTTTGQATIKLLKLNAPDLLILRRILTEAGRYS